MGGSEGVKRILRRMRGHASYAYNRIVSCVKGDICKEVIEDPALDEMWEAAEKDEGYQRVAVRMSVEHSSVTPRSPSGSLRGPSWA